MRRLDDNEMTVLRTILRLGAVKGDLLSIARDSKRTVAETIDIINYLKREGFLTEIDRRYYLSEEGAHAVGRKLMQER